MYKVLLIISLLLPIVVFGENVQITDKNGRVTGYIKEMRSGDDLRLTDKNGRTTGYIKKRDGKVFITDPSGSKTYILKK